MPGFPVGGHNYAMSLTTSLVTTEFSRELIAISSRGILYTCSVVIQFINKLSNSIYVDILNYRQPVHVIIYVSKVAHFYTGYISHCKFIPTDLRSDASEV